MKVDELHGMDRQIRYNIDFLCKEVREHDLGSLIEAIYLLFTVCLKGMKFQF